MTQMQKRLWGVSIITGWLMLQGTFFALLCSFALVGGGDLDSVLALSMPAVLCLGAGIKLRQQQSSGWWLAVFVFAFGLSGILAALIPQLIAHVIPGSPWLQPAMSEVERIKVSFGAFWDALLWSGLLANVIPLLYLTRASVREHFSIW